MRIGIVGSREPTPAMKRRLRRYVRELDPFVTVVSGGARGIDSYAVLVAEEYGLATEVMPADWANDGRKAGHLRNARLVDSVDLLVAFWDGRSRGTRNAIDHAKHMVKPFVVVVG